MSRYDVTSELASTIKTARLQNGITASEVAEHIGKNRAFMTRLENCQVKTIQDDVLMKILRFVFKADEMTTQELEETLGNIYATLQRKLTTEELNHQLWLMNYDTVNRKIPVPRSLVEDIRSRMDMLGISSDDLYHKINANETLQIYGIDENRYPVNLWRLQKVEGDMILALIRFSFPKEDISNLNSGNMESASYILPLSICYCLEKLEKYGDTVLISEAEDTDLYEAAKERLNLHRFYSISERSRLASLAKTDEEKERLLSAFDKRNGDLVNEVLTEIKSFSDYDLNRCNKVLESFIQNLKWDIGFMMTILEMPYRELSNTSIPERAELIKEIVKLIHTYKANADSGKAINTYEI